MAEFKITQTRCVSMPRLRWKPKEEHLFGTYWHRFVEPADYFDPNRECMIAVLLNCRDFVIGHHLVSIGTLTNTLTTSREVFRAAIIGAAHSIVMMHNHPSDVATPSELDIETTRQLSRAGELLGIRLLDHIIVTRDTIFSHRIAGLI